jgi:hypothetical protein
MMPLVSLLLYTREEDDNDNDGDDVLLFCHGKAHSRGMGR